MKCTYCNQDFTELEDWGDRKLCKKCAEHFHKTFPENPPSKTSDIEIMEPRVTSVGSYHPSTGATRFWTDDENDVFLVLNHEFLHYILHIMIGLRCCYQLDNFRDEVDLYHSSGCSASR